MVEPTEKLSRLTEAFRSDHESECIFQEAVKEGLEKQAVANVKKAKQGASRTGAKTAAALPTAK